MVSSIGVLSIRVKKSGNVVLSEKKPSYKDLEGAAEQERMLEHYGGSGENTASALEDPNP